jgi:two-component system sensor histidine kinase AtoS
MKALSNRKVFKDRRKKFDQLKIKKEKNFNSAELLAAGVAHEFNNILGALDGHAEWALEEGDLNSMKEALEIVRKGCARSSEITRALGAMGQPREESWARVDVLSLIKEALQLVSSLGNLKFELVVSPQISKLKIGANATALVEVFVNLFKNALEAGAQKVRVTLGQKKQKGNSVFHIEIEDDGPGVNLLLEKAIFEPFFTTKGALSSSLGVDAKPESQQKQKGGSGLGLFLVRNIIGEHGGKISLSPKKSKLGGAHFKIELPVK